MKFYTHALYVCICCNSSSLSTIIMCHFITPSSSLLLIYICKDSSLCHMACEAFIDLLWHGIKFQRAKCHAVLQPERSREDPRWPGEQAGIHAGPAPAGRRDTEGAACPGRESYREPSERGSEHFIFLSSLLSFMFHLQYQSIWWNLLIQRFILDLISLVYFKFFYFALITALILVFNLLPEETPCNGSPTHLNEFPEVLGSS